MQQVNRVSEIYYKVMRSLFRSGGLRVFLEMGNVVNWLIRDCYRANSLAESLTLKAYSNLCIITWY